MCYLLISFEDFVILFELSRFSIHKILYVKILRFFKSQNISPHYLQIIILIIFLHYHHLYYYLISSFTNKVLTVKWTYNHQNKVKSANVFSKLFKNYENQIKGCLLLIMAKTSYTNTVLCKHTKSTLFKMRKIVFAYFSFETWSVKINHILSHNLLCWSQYRAIPSNSRCH